MVLETTTEAAKEVLSSHFPELGGNWDQGIHRRLLGNT